MNNYIVVLKLNMSESHYLALNSYLKSATYWAKLLPNIWIIKTIKSSSEVRDGLKQRVKLSDKVAVISISNKDWASFNIDQEVTEWMRKNL